MTYELPAYTGVFPSDRDLRKRAAWTLRYYRAHMPQHVTDTAAISALTRIANSSIRLQGAISAIIAEHPDLAVEFTAAAWAANVPQEIVIAIRNAALHRTDPPAYEAGIKEESK